MDRLGCIFLAVLAAFAVSPGAQSSRTSAQKGAEYLVSKQLPSGAFFAEGRPADGTAEILASLAAGGVQGRAVELGLEQLRSNAPKRARVKAAYAARIAMGIKASGEDPRSFGGFDYVGAIHAFYKEPVGAFDQESIYGHALSLLGISSSGERPPDGAVNYLKQNQCATGGYSHTPGCTLPADTDTTALAINALVAAGLSAVDTSISAARDFLSLTQRNDGGFALEPHKPTDRTNANSTALALSAITALGESPTTSRWVKGSNDPLGVLTSLQSSEGGFRLYANDAGINDYATIQAIPGVALRAYPIMPLAATSGVRSTDDLKLSPAEQSGVVGEEGSKNQALTESTQIPDHPTVPNDQSRLTVKDSASLATTPRSQGMLNTALWTFLVTTCMLTLVLTRVSNVNR